VSPFELAAGGSYGLRAQYQALPSKLRPLDPPPPPVSAERVLASIPSFVRNEAIKRVSEDDARALADMGPKRSERRSAERQRNAVAQLADDALRVPSARDVMLASEPMDRAASGAQTCIPVVTPLRDLQRLSGGDGHPYASSEGASRRPSINISVSLPPPPQTMSTAPSPLPPPPELTPEERAQAAEERRHDRRCAYWQKAGQSVGTLAAGLIGSVGLTLSACNCCTKASADSVAAAAMTDGNDQMHLMAGFGWPS
jgi:hypothetical protein